MCYCPSLTVTLCEELTKSLFSDYLPFQHTATPRSNMNKTLRQQVNAKILDIIKMCHCHYYEWGGNAAQYDRSRRKSCLAVKRANRQSMKTDGFLGWGFTQSHEVLDDLCICTVVEATLKYLFFKTI